MTTARPLLFLDVDGPLNPYAAKPHRRPDGYQTHRMRPTGWKAHERRKPLRVWLNPTHGPALLALPFDLVWATTWGAEANEWIGPCLGLPELPVIEWHANSQRSREGTPDGTFWKTHQIVEYAAGRPFAWIDDDIHPHDMQYVAKHHDGPALLHWISPQQGLLPHDLDTLAVWSKDPTKQPLPW
ncbi:HAD domain-containing protein [Streptomyces abikoensis]|uniref:HAD domain-containing protein n=1 Tax=Streptomyces abikoensis TaxID=97398 RepID=UPI001677E595|nr:HAD domain-containing protein [Streptomyces abikoensis]GGP55663.1 hypothetical protein GCM10010214_31070 [Streptomyces abikoensis]